MKSRSLSTKPAAADRAKLTRQTIVRAALELLNEEGLDRLSTRRLAARLGVQSATLYWHVKNKQELLDMMAAAILFRAPPGFVMRGSWWVWMGDLARQIRRNLLEYRDGARVMAGTRPTDALGPTGIEELFEGMHTQGLDRTQAWHVLASLSRFALGWAIDEQAARSSGHVTGSAINFDAEFEFGLQALIDGLRRAWRSRRTPKGSAN
jgi:TetR/AcrR family transcriptional regulator, tetracycline repressor protein